MTNIVSTVTAMLGGADAATGAGGVWQVTLTGTWALGDAYSLTLTEVASGRSLTLGEGALTGAEPTFALTYKKKLYLIGGGQTMFFSALEEPTIFNDLNQAGNSFMDLSNEYGLADDLLAGVIYQGRMAVFARRSIQIVQVDPDPANYAVGQTLENIGTVNGASVRGMGDYDVLFCADSGVRSLRVRDSSNNAQVMDLGTPIDSLVQARLLSVGTATMASIVEPISGRYWLAIGNLVYVFSYFPSSGIAAWSTYEPGAVFAASSSVYGGGPAEWFVTWAGLTVGKAYSFKRGATERSYSCVFTHDGVDTTNADVTFVATDTSATVTVTAASNPGGLMATLLELWTPEKFVVYNGQIYARSTDGIIYRYGGTDNATYDSSPCTWETPWLDAREAATKKLGASVDAGLEGGWSIALGMDPVSGILTEVYHNTASSYGLGVVPSTMRGNHFKVRGQTYGATYARFSTFALHFQGGDNR